MERVKAYIKGVDEKDVFTVVASSEARDREGEVLPAKGWELDNFNKNPVLLWAHDATSLPIGKVTDIAVKGTELVAKFVFGAHDFAQDVKQLVKDKILNAVSVGFMPTGENEKGETTGQELLELSIVNVPANQEALITNQYKSFVAKHVEKEGRIISEKNRTIMRNARDTMEQASEALGELLEATEPPPKEKAAPITKSKPLPKKSPSRLVRALKLVDRSLEVALHEAKKGGAKND